ncbi:vanadium-dependent haloperoxidase [Nitrosovibrio sp. Nv6]|uniref:vanadium-dependent haloperoxidase n=1 Tax=Nitrosovibrio sp. Nv6 TaxID=1855340 RepID=UPI0008CC800F|nr:vanadium-dependent haloperoxidase [Nitrosovibrio sp. Nv6]SEO66071.1 PAP2 superfamily protein [Nitrosovibrio sp. Nv6]
MIQNIRTRSKTGLLVTVLAIAAATLFVCPMAKADAVTDWNRVAGGIVVDANLGPLPADRVLAIVHTAVYEAANAITRRYPGDPSNGPKLKALPGASVDAAIASAARTVLAELVPSGKTAIEAAYHAALALVPGGSAKTEGISVGEKAAAAILTRRANDGIAGGETYRPHTSPGMYVPTVIPEAPHWLQIKPWLMASASQFRPGPPPPLTSELWARDYNEVKTLGSKHSTRRSAKQTAIAHFWEEVMPPIYHGIVRSVADVPGREITQNARLFAMVTQASNDALIAVFDAKYHYGFWRPVTAIRNGDIDGNDATERDPSWLPFIDTPMHPEYPCAHCIVSGAVGAVLQAEIGVGPTPLLTTTSHAAGGVARSWTGIDEFIQEVANARIYDGVHYRNSAEVGTAMGKQIGELAATKYPGPIR